MTAPVVLRSEPDITESFEPFQERLAETISWCLRAVKLGPLATALRTIAFVPPPALAWPDTVRAVAEARLKTLGRSWRRTLSSRAKEIDAIPACPIIPSDPPHASVAEGPA